MTDITIETSTVADLAAAFEFNAKSAEDKANDYSVKVSRREEAALRATASTWRAAAGILRATKIVQHKGSL